MKSIQEILLKTVEGERLQSSEAFTLLTEADWTDVVQAAHKVRLQKHDPKIVSYTAFRVINYTNVCDIDCSFCSFKDEVNSKHAYVLSLEQMREKALHAKEVGADQIFLQGGVHSELPLKYYTDAIHMFAKELNMHVRALSPVEIFRLAEHEKISIVELLEVLKSAGLGSVPGAGAELLTERMRARLSPKKLSAEKWCEVMGECHKFGLPGSANIVFGSSETAEDIIEHFEIIRNQQDLTKGFLTFVPWIFQPQTKDFFIRPVQSREYLKVLALSRLFFDNISNIEVSIMVMGKRLGELGLYAGANDINSIVIEENVLKSSGLKSLNAAEKFIRNAGFEPKRRSLNFD